MRVVDLFRNPLVVGTQARHVTREHEDPQSVLGTIAVRQQKRVHAESRQSAQRRGLEERLVAERHFFRVRRFLAKVSKNLAPSFTGFATCFRRAIR